jgi:hypothetical protein
MQHVGKTIFLYSTLFHCYYFQRENFVIVISYNILFRYVSAITGILSLIMFLPGIFTEYTIEDDAEEDRKTPLEDLTRQESTHNPKEIIRVFSTVSFNGPPPLETRKSQALISLASNGNSVPQTKSFWGNYQFI